LLINLADSRGSLKPWAVRILDHRGVRANTANR